MPLGDALHALTVMAAVVIVSVAAGRVFRRIGQPGVLGPILAGIVVGTGLAACPESVRTVIVPDGSHHVLDAAGTAGLVLLMFTVGTELRGLGKSGATPAGWRLIPAAVIPIAVCALAAWPFADRLGVAPHPAWFCWVFVGTALGITAVPVLVLIIGDLGISSQLHAKVALGIATTTDGLAWILVTTLVVVSTDLSRLSIPALVTGAALLAVAAFLVPRHLTRSGTPDHGTALGITVVVSALTGAAGTQLLGFHPAIGAVIAGYFFPVDIAAALSRRTLAALFDVLLPAFFVSIAMSVPLQALRELASWPGLCCVIVLAVVALTSKLAAGLLFGATSDWPWRSSAKLGVLLDCRGVTEIAIASVGFQAALISPFAFAALCGLAMLTTAATAPLYRALTEKAPDLAGSR